MPRVLVILLLLWPLALWGQETSPESVAPARQTGDYLLRTCTASALTPTGRLRRQYCAGYLAGVEETLRVVTTPEGGFCPPAEVSTRELSGVYTRYVAANPDSTRRPAAATAAQALRQAFPCASEPGR